MVKRLLLLMKVLVISIGLTTCNQPTDQQMDTDTDETNEAKKGIT